MRPLGSKENRRKTLVTIMSITVHPNPIGITDPMDVKIPVGVDEPVVGTLIIAGKILITVRQ